MIPAPTPDNPSRLARWSRPKDGITTLKGASGFPLLAVARSDVGRRQLSDEAQRVGWTVQRWDADGACWLTVDAADFVGAS